MQSKPKRMRQFIFLKHLKTQMYNLQTSPIMANLMAVSKRIRQSQINIDDAEMFTSEVHDPYARTTGA